MSSCFKLTMPNGYKKNIYYNKSDNKIDLIKEHVLSYWEEYLLSHWIWTHKFEQGRLNFEDKTKYLLDKCATFLLLSDFKKYDIQSNRKRNNTYENEILLSCTPDDIQDIVYSTNIESDNITQTPKRSSAIHSNEIIMNAISNNVFKVHKKRLPKIKKRYVNSQQYKIKKIYTTDDRIVKRLYKIKNGDLQEKPLNKNLSENELLKWQNKPFKNIFGENIYEYRTKVVKGNKGLIDPKQPYKWAWCYVNTCNEFEFNNKKYQIDKSVKQYQGRLENTRRKDKEVVYDMDMILCYGQGGKQYYFDQNIDRINSKHIVQI